MRTPGKKNPRLEKTGARRRGNSLGDYWNRRSHDAIQSLGRIDYRPRRRAYGGVIGEDPPGTMSPEEIARRVEASILAEEAANPHLSIADRHRNQATLQFVRSRLGIPIPGYTPSSPATPSNYFQSRANEAIQDLGRTDYRPRRRRRGTGGTLGSTAGSIAGEALIPIPGVGSALGGVAGGLVGDLYEKGLKGSTATKLATIAGGPVGAAIALALGGGEKPKYYATSRATTYRKGGSIHIKKENRGKFTAAAKRAGMGVQEYARHVLAHPERYSAKLRKRANFARNASKWKKERGGKMEEYAQGGAMMPIGQDAMKVMGPNHEQGGVPVPGTNYEVEGGETIDMVKGEGYVFSKQVKVPGTSMSFARLHEMLVKNGATRHEIERLAALQERVNKAGDDRTKYDLGGFLSGIVDYIKDPKRGGKLFSDIAPYAGDLINISRGLFGGSGVPNAAREDDTAARAARQFTYDVRPQLSALSATTNAVLNDPNASVSQKLGAHANALRAQGQILSEKSIQEARARLGALDALQGVASRNADYQEQYRQDVQGAKAAREAILSEGLAGLSRTRQGLERDRRTTEMDIFKGIASLGIMDEAERQNFLKSLRSFVPAEYLSQWDAMITAGDHEGAARLIKEKLKRKPFSPSERRVPVASAGPVPVPGAEIDILQYR